MADSTFEDLLARMPDIAAAIKGLPEAMHLYSVVQVRFEWRLAVHLAEVAYPGVA